MIEPYITKVVPFRFRGFDFEFALSQGLFSSADIDTGTRFLLRVFAKTIDDDLASGRPLPRSILDAGSGVGVLGICAARALAERAPGVHVRAQDRDELARLFTEYNARQNGLAPETLGAYTEPLLSGAPDSRWDLILSNVPAKAGTSVLEDFIARSAALLAEGGLVLVVVVNPLADFFRARITALGLAPVHDEAEKGHTVLGYGRAMVGRDQNASAVKMAADIALSPVLAENFPDGYPAYFRTGGDYALEGIGYHIDALEGVAGFDNPGGAVRAAAKLVSRLGPDCFRELRRTGAGETNGAAGSDRAETGRTEPAGRGALLVHEPDQGHFAVWLMRYLDTAADRDAVSWTVTLSGRNILALEAARRNLRDVPARTVPAVDLLTHRAELRSAVCGAAAGDGGAFACIAIFPELIPMTKRLDAYWEGLAGLLVPGGVALIALGSSGAEQFDRVKPKGFTRLADVKREGFRAIAYRLMW